MSYAWPGWRPSEYDAHHETKAGRVYPGDPCVNCGLPHTKERRLAVLRRCEGMSPLEIAAAYPDLWPDAEDSRSPGYKKLYRDLASLRKS